jgi:hypothetical protein
VYNEKNEGYTLQPIPSEFLIFEENFVFFFISVECTPKPWVLVWDPGVGYGSGPPSWNQRKTFFVARSAKNDSFYCAI